MLSESDVRGLEFGKNARMVASFPLSLRASMVFKKPSSVKMVKQLVSTKVGTGKPKKGLRLEPQITKQGDRQIRID